MSEKGEDRKDKAWKYTKKTEGEKYFRCVFCNQTCSGTISRLKHHLAGTPGGMKACNKVPAEVKKEYQILLKGFKDDKNKRSILLREIGAGIGGDNDEEFVSNQSGGAQPKTVGPLDKFVFSEPRQTTMNEAYKKELRKDICRRIGRFIFSKALPFNTVNDPFWLPMVEGIASFGVGFKPPSMHELRTWILKEEVEDIDTYLLVHKKAWKQYGCSIMSDGWTDGKNRVLINFLINSPAGTWFLKSIDASGSIKNGSLMLKYLDDVVNEVEEENVVQIITDNASNYKNAGTRLMEKRERLWWTPCAAHCIDLMLEDISKLTVYDQTIKSAKQVVKFIYGHTWVLSLMREFTSNKEIIRPAITRFATSFLTLQSIYKQKQPLQMMFNSKQWCEGPFVKSHEAINVRAIVLFKRGFWSDISFCIKGVLPLVCVLREVDSELRPAMGYIYELMDAAKEKIAFNLQRNLRHYQPIWNKIDARWTPQLHQPLHAAGYYLNPQFRYEENFSNVCEVKKGLYDCMDRMMPFDDRLKADIQLDMYDKCMGDFGSRLAIHSRKIRSPGTCSFCLLIYFFLLPCFGCCHVLFGSLFWLLLYFACCPVLLGFLFCLLPYF
jgi:hypothetical protein